MHTTYILSYYTCHVYHNEFKVATFPSQHHKMENMEGAPTQIFRPHHPTTKTQRSHILYMYHMKEKVAHIGASTITDGLHTTMYRKSLILNGVSSEVWRKAG